MSTRAKIASAAASIGVLAIGWQIGTAGGQTTQAAAPTTTTATTNTNSSTKTQSTTTATTQTASSAAMKSGTYTGTTVTHRYGTVTVTVTITNGSITNVTASADDQGDNNSARINASALETLKAEVLAANSADVSTISGATYTSGAYLQSLQSALDQA